MRHSLESDFAAEVERMAEILSTEGVEFTRESEERGFARVTRLAKKWGAPPVAEMRRREGRGVMRSLSFKLIFPPRVTVENDSRSGVEVRWREGVRGKESVHLATRALASEPPATVTHEAI